LVNGSEGLTAGFSLVGTEALVWNWGFGANGGGPIAFAGFKAGKPGDVCPPFNISVSGIGKLEGR